MTHEGFVDIHCHLLPAIDDGASSWEQSLEMARIAIRESIFAIVATPHQLGAYVHNDAQMIRARTVELQQLLDQQGLPLRVLPGADVRIEETMLQQILSGEVLTLGDHGKHVLLELPHEIYFDIDPLLTSLTQAGITGILSHPERNSGLLRRRKPVESLVNQGCLMQVTAGSLEGRFGPPCQKMAEWMIQQGLVHFISTDAHGSTSRRPLMKAAFDRVVELTDLETAVDLCCRNPGSVSRGEPVVTGHRPAPIRKSKSWFRLGRTSCSVQRSA